MTDRPDYEALVEAVKVFVSTCDDDSVPAAHHVWSELVDDMRTALAAIEPQGETRFWTSVRELAKLRHNIPAERRSISGAASLLDESPEEVARKMMAIAGGMGANWLQREITKSLLAFRAAGVREEREPSGDLSHAVEVLRGNAFSHFVSRGAWRQQGSWWASPSGRALVADLRSCIAAIRFLSPTPDPPTPGDKP